MSFKDTEKQSGLAKTSLFHPFFSSTRAKVG